MYKYAPRAVVCNTTLVYTISAPSGCSGLGEKTEGRAQDVRGPVATTG